MAQMRKRSLPSMTNYEIETYLKRNDVIFIPVGNAEMHGPYPVDVEYVQAEAWARLFAEKFDGLVLPNLVYFAAGGTAIGRGTVQMGLFDGMKYMYAIARSLLQQGFRRQVYIPSHRSSTLFMHPVIHQIMDDCKVPLLMLEPHHLFAAKGIMPKRDRLAVPHNFTKFHIISDEKVMGQHAMSLGAYKICGRLDDVPTGSEANIYETVAQEGWPSNRFFPDHDIINECSDVHCPAPFFYKEWWDHGGAPLPETQAEIEREAEIGEKFMRGLVEEVDFNVHLDVLRRLDKFTQDEVLPLHKDHLPPDRWSY